MRSTSRSRCSSRNPTSSASRASVVTTRSVGAGPLIKPRTRSSTPSSRRCGRHGSGRPRTPCHLGQSRRAHPIARPSAWSTMSPAISSERSLRPLHRSSRCRMGPSTSSFPSNRATTIEVVTVCLEPCGFPELTGCPVPRAGPGRFQSRWKFLHKIWMATAHECPPTGDSDPHPPRRVPKVAYRIALAGREAWIDVACCRIDHHVGVSTRMRIGRFRFAM